MDSKPKKSDESDNSDALEKIRLINVAQEMVPLKDRVATLKVECDRKEALLADLKEKLLENERLQDITSERQRELVFLLLRDEELRRLAFSDSICKQIEDLLTEVPK